MTISSGEKSENVLGLKWDKTTDTLSIHTPKLKGPVYTKMISLSNLAKFWDPLKLIALALVTLQVKLQGLWDNQSSEWDDQIRDDDKEWLELFEEVLKS